MYFWKIDRIKNEIINSEFGDKKLFPYILISVFFGALVFELQQFFPASDLALVDYIFSITSVFITIMGTFYIYDANGGAEGRDFAAKYFAIGLVMAIRFAVLMFALSAVVGIVIGVLSEIGLPYVPYDVSLEGPVMSFIWLTLFVVVYLGFFMRWAKHVRDTVVA